MFKGLMVVMGTAAGIGVIAGGLTYATYMAIDKIPKEIHKIKGKLNDKKAEKEKIKEREEEYNIVYYLNPDEYEVESL